jgi:8-oxo-dGTP pyrophosphatase MutT (NUDIX family)
MKGMKNMKAGIDYVGIGVGVIIQNEVGVLLLKRSQLARHNKNKWDLPGGEHEFYETLEQTVVREALEETGYVIKPMYQLSAQKENIDGQQWLTIPYVGNIVGGSLDLNLERETFDDKRFFALHNLPKDITRQSLDTIQRYMAWNERNT